MLRWPTRQAVDAAVETWVRREAARHPELLRIGIFGSYARGSDSVGSDLDLIAIVRDSAQPFEMRSVSWNLIALPVPAEMIVYTEREWEQMLLRQDRFANVMKEEVRWLDFS